MAGLGFENRDQGGNCSEWQNDRLCGERSVRGDAAHSWNLAHSILQAEVKAQGSPSEHSCFTAVVLLSRKQRWGSLVLGVKGT